MYLKHWDSVLCPEICMMILLGLILSKESDTGIIVSNVKPGDIIFYFTFYLKIFCRLSFILIFVLNERVNNSHNSYI